MNVVYFISKIRSIEIGPTTGIIAGVVYGRRNGTLTDVYSKNLVHIWNILNRNRSDLINLNGGQKSEVHTRILEATFDGN